MDQAGIHTDQARSDQICLESTRIRAQISRIRLDMVKPRRSFLVKKCFFSESPGMVGKMFPHPVGVFCTLLDTPNVHIDHFFILCLYLVY